jgi:hypothetical protein
MTAANEAPAHVTLTTDEDGRTVWNTGSRRYVFWKAWDGRMRWALRDRPDDGLAIPTHGAARDLVLAVEAAWRNNEEREQHNGTHQTT